MKNYSTDHIAIIARIAEIAIIDHRSQTFLPLIFAEER